MNYDNGCGIERCGNSRTGNSPYCYQHTMQRRRNNDTPTLFKVPTQGTSINLSPDDSIPSTSDETIENMQDVFDDFGADGEDITTKTFTDEAAGVIRGAVSSEFMRNAERLDLDQESARVDATQGMSEYLTSSFQIRTNPMSADDAYELAHSSSDRHGRSLEDASHLTGFALHQKYHYGKMNGLRADESEIPFSLPESEFIQEHEEQMRQEVVKQLAVESYRYNDTFREQFGRPPKIDAPIENPALRGLAQEASGEQDSDPVFKHFDSISPEQETEKATNFLNQRMQAHQEEEKRRRDEAEKLRRESEARRAEIAENERLRKEAEKRRIQSEQPYRSDPQAEAAERQRMSDEERLRQEKWDREQDDKDRRAEVAKAVSSRLIHGFFNGVERRAEKNRRGSEEFYRKQGEKKRERDLAKREREDRQSRHMQDRANEEIIKNLRRRR